MTRAPMQETIVPRRQAAPRHYGAHQYFTRRAWNVVQAYIAHFTEPGDLVLDPFGGAGTTAIEALVLRRRAVHVDLSPFACFLARAAALAPVDVDRLERAFEAVIERTRGADPHREPWAPRGMRLPKSADVETVPELFSDRALRDLGNLLEAIELEAGSDEELRLLLRYAFSATLYKCSRTFLSAPGRAPSRGGSSIFSIYRYKVAREPVDLPVLEQYRLRARRVLAAKRDANSVIGGFGREPGALRLLCRSACALGAEVPDASVDYIFTDPPYGGHIAYLDLAALFNAWLGLEVPDLDRSREAIEGGDLGLTRAHYLDRIALAAREMRRVLKDGRWLSLVYAHRDRSLWEAIIERFQAAGFSFRNAVRQPVSVVWSMHKKKNPGSSLAGELVLNFAAARARPRSARAIAAHAHEAILDIQRAGAPGDPKAH